MNQALAIKYRPRTFEEVVGQPVVVKILKKVIEAGKPKNAYLFAGATGSGKTSLARIFARELNKGEGSPIEIDAASNNGVDQVRAIIEEANQRSLTSTYKIFIIDEAHAITQQGWQAFLKSIEEPPAYTIYIFCTTEPQKLPAMILNRVQRYNIARIPQDKIKERLEYICQAEGFVNYTDTCDLISKISSGCMRDAITALDQCADLSKDLCLENTKDILGDVSYETMLRLTNFLIDGNEGEVLSLLENLYNSGKDLKQFIEAYLSFILDATKYIIFKDIRLTSIPAYLETIQDTTINIKYTVAIQDNLNWFNKLTDKLLELKLAIKYDVSYRTTIEAFLIRICRGI